METPFLLVQCSHQSYVYHLKKKTDFEIITDNERILLETYRRDSNIKEMIDRLLAYTTKIKDKKLLIRF